MNLILFVFSILVVFALQFSLSFERSLLSLKVEKEMIERKEAIRKIHNSYALKEFKSLKAIPKKSSGSKSSGSSKGKIKKKEEVPPCTRLNLYPLLQGQDRELSDIAIALFSQLYHDFFLEYEISLPAFFSLFIEKAKVAMEKKPFHIGKIDFEDERLQHFYYLLLQQHSLDKYITFSNEKSPICMPCISFATLSALCGEKRAMELWQKKEDPMERFSRSDLEGYIDKHSKKYLRFSHPRAKQKSIYTGEAEKIKLRRSW